MKAFTKHYQPDKYEPYHRTSGLTALEAFDLEVRCLELLSESRHFPEIVAVDRDSLSITMEHCGVPVLEGSMPKNYEKQIREIIDDMEAAGVVHLDNHPSGRHVFVKGGVLKIIDFDVAYIEGEPKTRQIARRHHLFLTGGGYGGYAAKLKKIVTGGFENEL